MLMPLSYLNEVCFMSSRFYRNKTHKMYINMFEGNGRVCMHMHV